MSKTAAVTEPRPRISDAEWTVMDVLWDRSPLASSEVVERLEPTTEWRPRTIKTLLGRLVKKGFLGYQEDGPRYLYHPRVARREVVRQESRSFARRLFGGDEASMLLHFARTVELDPEEADALRRLLDEKDSRGEGPGAGEGDGP